MSKQTLVFKMAPASSLNVFTQNTLPLLNRIKQELQTGGHAHGHTVTKGEQVF